MAHIDIREWEKVTASKEIQVASGDILHPPKAGMHLAELDAGDIETKYTLMPGNKFKACRGVPTSSTSQSFRAAEHKGIPVFGGKRSYWHPGCRQALHIVNLINREQAALAVHM
ncbi:hypothetical protein H5410_064499 [Solanum commersonii]|uniref:Uncharacterized protein n=1 Tax=Solanum commersonii TaxID=4109 RepID=A0A9J5VZ64_SOLCO|nr:hypothetical protein H5410_064499 [Solanum commersonii]